MVLKVSKKRTLPVVLVMGSFLLMFATVTLASRVSNDYMREQIAYQRNFLLVEPAIDEWTTCISLLAFSGQPEHQSILYRASMVALPVQIDEAPCDELKKWVDAEVTRDISSTTYARYWFGGAAIMRLLSSVTAGFDAARTVIAGVWVILFALYFSLCRLKFGALPIVIFAAVSFFTTDLIAALKTPHVALSFIASLLFGIAMMVFPRSNESLLAFAFGIWLPFFDPLTHPVFYVYVALTPVVLRMYALNEQTLGKAKTLSRLGLTWAVGYSLSWIVKWTLASIFGEGFSVYRDSFDQVIFRASGAVNGKPLGFLDGIYANIDEFLHRPFATTLIAIVAVYTLTSIVLRLRNGLKIGLTNFLLCFSIGLAPLLNFLILKSHSFEHSWMTYRSLGTSFGLALACLYLSDGDLFSSRDKRLP